MSKYKPIHPAIRRAVTAKPAKAGPAFVEAKGKEQGILEHALGLNGTLVRGFVSAA